MYIYVCIVLQQRYCYYYYCSTAISILLLQYCYYHYYSTATATTVTFGGASGIAAIGIAAISGLLCATVSTVRAHASAAFECGSSSERKALRDLGAFVSAEMSLRYRCVIAALSLHYRCVISALSLRYLCDGWRSDNVVELSAIATGAVVMQQL